MVGALVAPWCAVLVSVLVLVLRTPSGVVVTGAVAAAVSISTSTGTTTSTSIATGSTVAEGIVTGSIIQTTVVACHTRIKNPGLSLITSEAGPTAAKTTGVVTRSVTRPAIHWTSMVPARLKAAKSYRAPVVTRRGVRSTRPTVRLPRAIGMLVISHGVHPIHAIVPVIGHNHHLETTPSRVRVMRRGPIRVSIVVVPVTVP